MLPAYVRTVGAITLAVLAPFGILLLFAFWVFDGHGAAMSRLAQVHPGMTRKQVTAILGKPSTINGNADGSETWYYSKITWCQVKVHTSPRGIVDGKYHDH
jgi:outer membrane protein assembly factor BamE (lipoprotein component of BamABCDE complex)